MKFIKIVCIGAGSGLAILLLLTLFAFSVAADMGVRWNIAL